MKFLALIAMILLASAAIGQLSPAPKAAVDQLIPWLLDEDQQLHGVAFSEVIFDTTGKKVISFDANNPVDQRIAKAIAAACDETMKRLNAPGNAIQNVGRINEVSSHFEDSLRELLNATSGLSCDFPLTAEGKAQRSGYPDLRIVDLESKRVFYLDPKLYAAGSRDSSFRTFYFEPKRTTNKVHDDAVHFIVGFQHEPRDGSSSPSSMWKFTRWDLVDLSHFEVKLKAEFQGSNATCIGRKQLWPQARASDPIASWQSGVAPSSGGRNGMVPMIAKAETFQFDAIDDVLSDIAKGRMVIVTDDADRENEGDLVMAAEKVTPEAVNFMATHGRGLVCVPISNERAEQLGLQRMVLQNREKHRTDFTVSVDAARGVTTGISAYDRATTILAIANPKSSPEDLSQPGHVFPLRAKDGGVLRRAGHTEAAVDLARMASLQPAGVLCEILHDDGTMARLPELMEFHKKHSLRICTIQGLIAYRRLREKLVELEQIVKMPSDYGDFDLHLYRSKLDGQHHLALVKGKIDKSKPTLVRVHSQCLTGDVFASRRCDCGNQLHAALRQIQEEGNGVLVYMRQEGRGIGLAAKIHAYKLQEEGLDTVEANAKLGYPSDLRDYGLGAQILFDLGVRQFRFLTNNPKKVVGLEGYGLEMIEQVPIRTEANPHNEKYLETKKTKLGHLL